MILDRIREGGPGAYLAIALGALGLLLGAVSLLSVLGKSRSSFALGVVTLIIAMSAAGAGMAGTAWGRHQVTNALGYVDSQVDKERLMRAGFREAQSASWIGLFAALVPLALGAAAAIGGSRVQAPKTRAQAFGDPMVSADDGLGGQTVVAFIFTAIGVIACGGAWAMANSELPKARYNFDDFDTQSWSLAAAIEDVERDSRNACRNLDESLDSYWGASDRREWPRKMRSTIPPELSAWRAAADTCTKKMIKAFGEPLGEETRFSQTGLLESPLLQDEALRAQVLAWEPEGASAEEGASGASDEEGEAPPPGGLGALNVFGANGLNDLKGSLGDPKNAKVGKGSLEPKQIRDVIQRNLAALRYCYERELTKKPKLEGKVVVDFTIGQKGNVVIAADASPQPFPEPKVTACVVSRFKGMQFPEPDGGGMVKVKYPLVFKAAE